MKNRNPQMGESCNKNNEENTELKRGRQRDKTKLDQNTNRAN